MPLAWTTAHRMLVLGWCPFRESHAQETMWDEGMNAATRWALGHRTTEGSRLYRQEEKTKRRHCRGQNHTQHKAQGTAPGVHQQPGRPSWPVLTVDWAPPALCPNQRHFSVPLTSGGCKLRVWVPTLSGVWSKERVSRAALSRPVEENMALLPAQSWRTRLRLHSGRSGLRSSSALRVHAILRLWLLTLTAVSTSIVVGVCQVPGNTPRDAHGASTRTDVLTLCLSALPSALIIRQKSTVKGLNFLSKVQ